MSFDKILGQELPKRIIRKALVNDSFSHAYILEGPKGIGKLTFAKTIAKALFCERLKDDSCEVCNNCRRIENGNYPDLYIIKPDGNSIKDIQIEEIQRNMNRKPFEANFNVFIIENADVMTTKAQNRFLKKLEEPTGNTIIMFLTENDNILLPTILSRCSKIKLSSLPENKISDYMIDKYKISRKEAELIAAFSYGVIGRADKLYESEEFIEIKEASEKIFETFMENESRSILDLIDLFESNKEDIKEILEMLVFQFRDIAILNVTENNKMIINIDNIKTIQKHSDIIGYMKSINIIQTIEIAKKDLSGNLNFNLVIKNMLLRMQEERNGKSSWSKI